MTTESFNLGNLQEFVGKELGISSWKLIDQARINAFAECTEDDQWIHVDVARAERESPFKATVGPRSSVSFCAAGNAQQVPSFLRAAYALR